MYNRGVIEWTIFNPGYRICVV